MNITTSSVPSDQRTHFEGSDQCVVTGDFKPAVNTSMTLQRLLFVEGEPGIDKIMLAEEVAAALGMPLLQWHAKSTTRAQRGSYRYDAASRLRDSQFGDDKVHDIRNCVVEGMLWQAFEVDEPVMLLIDEIDKVDVELPGDLLRKLDRMEFYVYETRETIRAEYRPPVTITSNNGKELSDAFLHHCLFYHIKFPNAETIQAIVDVHYPGIKLTLVRAALNAFCEMRNLPGLKKKPSTSELIDRFKLLLAGDIPPGSLHSQDRNTVIPSLHEILLKNK